MEKVLQLPHQKLIQHRNVTPLIQRQHSTIQSQQIVPKIVEKLTKTKEKCIVVQDIFSQVDEALQKRKAENNRLLEEVLDRENQLNYLQQQTKDQSSLNAAQSVSISVSEDNLDKFEQEIILFYETVLKDARNEHQKFLADIQETDSLLHSLACDMDTLSFFNNGICKEITTMSDELAGQERCIQDKEKRLEVVRSQLTHLIIEIKELEGNRDAATVESDRIQKEKVLLQTEHATLEGELAVIRNDIASKMNLQNEREAHLASLRLEVDASAAAILTTAEELEGERRAADIQVAEASDRLVEAVQARDALFVELERLRGEEAENIERVAETEERVAQRRRDASALVDQLVAVQIETTSVEAALNAARKDMDETQTKALDDAQKSEHFYQLTCLRMKELRDLHQRQPAAEHELFMMQNKLNADIATELMHVEQDAVRLAAAQASLSEENRQVEEFAELLCEQTAHLTVQIVVAFAAETHEQECLVDLQEEAARLGEKEVCLEGLKKSDVEEMERVEATLNEMRCMQETVCREVQDVTELETARSALNAQLVASSEELATLVPPSTLGDALQAELEGELETAQLALKEELHGAMLTELEEIRGCREKLAAAGPDALQSAGRRAQLEALELQGTGLQSELRASEERLLAANQLTESATAEATGAALRAIRAVPAPVAPSTSPFTPTTKTAQSTPSSSAFSQQPSRAVENDEEEDREVSFFSSPPSDKERPHKELDPPATVARIPIASFSQIVSPRKGTAPRANKRTVAAVEGSMSGTKRKIGGRGDSSVDRTGVKSLKSASDSPPFPQGNRLSAKGSSKAGGTAEKVSPREEETKRTKVAATPGWRPSQSKPASKVSSTGVSSSANWSREGVKTPNSVATALSAEAATRLAVARGQSKALSDSSLGSVSQQPTKHHKSLTVPPGTFRSMPAPKPTLKPVAVASVAQRDAPKKIASTNDWFNDDDSLFG